MLCSRCKKRAAVIFMSLGGDVNSAQGLCMPCAQEVGAGPLKDIMDKMGVSEQEFADMQEKISEAMKEVPELEEQPEEIIENEGFSSGGPMIKDLFSLIEVLILSAMLTKKIKNQIKLKRELKEKI